MHGKGCFHTTGRGSEIDDGQHKVDDKRPITCPRRQVYDEVLNMSEISSGLVAVAWQVRNGWSSCDLYRTLKSATEDRDMLQKRADFAGNLMAYRVEPLVRLSDAEAIIAQKDAEILEQCRINGMGAERELALRGQMERQDERIKGLEEQAQSLARSVMCDQVSNDSHSLFLAAIRDLAAINECLGLDPDDGGAVPIIDAIEAQSAALKLAKDALESCDVGDCSTSYVVMPSFDAVAIDEALAAIDALKGE